MQNAQSVLRTNPWLRRVLFCVLKICKIQYNYMLLTKPYQFFFSAKDKPENKMITEKLVVRDGIKMITASPAKSY